MRDPQPGPAAQNQITLYVRGLREAKGLLPKHTRLEALVLEASLLKGAKTYIWQEKDLWYLDGKVLVPQRGRGD
jgi:hypothetical protein